MEDLELRAVNVPDVFKSDPLPSVRRMARTFVRLTECSSEACFHMVDDSDVRRQIRGQHKFNHCFSELNLLGLAQSLNKIIWALLELSQCSADVVAFKHSFVVIPHCQGMSCVDQKRVVHTCCCAL